MAAIKLSPPRRTVVKTNGNGKPKQDFAVRDLSLAEWGRKTIQVSEHEMPGLMSIRKKYGAGKPLKGCLLYTSPSPRDRQKSRMPSSA